MVELQPDNEKNHRDLMTTSFRPTKQFADILSVKAKQLLLGLLVMIFKTRGFKYTTWQTSGPGLTLKKRQLYKPHPNDCGCSQEKIAKASTKVTVLGQEGRRYCRVQEGKSRDTTKIQ